MRADRLVADRLVIDGGDRMRGAVTIAGARNAALPTLAATLLASGRTTLRNVPRIGDVATMAALLVDLGADVKGGSVTRIDTARVSPCEVPWRHIEALRASFLVLGPLLGRHGEARVPLPGASALGPRPLDQLLTGLAALGAAITIEHGAVVARAPRVARARRRLQGARFAFDVVTIAGTETLLLAAVLAQGRTVLENVACEPEIEELARLLNKMGARVKGAGTTVITIEGVDEVRPADHTLVADRAEAATLVFAAAMTAGDVRLVGCVPEHLEAVLVRVRSAGAEVTADAEGLRVRGPREILPIDVATRPYPGFPSDAQAPLLAFMTQARGQSMLTETVFEQRFGHVAELRRMGADIVLEGRTAIVRGPRRLQGAKVVAHDLRAAASLVLAGLIAEGTTEVLRVHHLDSGYERLDKKLRQLGARISRRTERGRS